MKVVLLHDGGSDEWSATDLAAVLGNLRAVE